MEYIYRVENVDGIGPYSLPSSLFLLDSHNQDPVHHPTPYRDNGIYRGCQDGEICGFDTLEKLKQWFTYEELVELNIRGFSVKKVPCEITARGEKQVLAKRWQD